MKCFNVVVILFLAFILGWSVRSDLPDPAQADTSAMFALIHKQKAMLAEDKRVIDAWLGIDWDRSKPIRTDCYLATWLDRELCKVYQDEEVDP